MSYYIGKRNAEKQRIARYVLRMAKKLTAIKIKGNKCKFCDENRPWVLQFHHYKGKKEIGIHAIMGCSWGRIKKELKKCILICERCHRKISGKKTLKKSIRHKLLLLDFKKVYSCKKCNYNECLKALDFHHLKRKDIDLSNQIAQKWTLRLTKEIKKELNKCEVLCANCHRDEHFDKAMFFKYENDIKNKMISLQDNYSKKVDRQKLLQLNKMGYTQSKIAKMATCGESTVCEVLKLNGIHTYKNKDKMTNSI